MNYWGSNSAALALTLPVPPSMHQCKDDFPTSQPKWNPLEKLEGKKPLQLAKLKNWLVRLQQSSSQEAPMTLNTQAQFHPMYPTKRLQEEKQNEYQSLRQQANRQPRLTLIQPEHCQGDWCPNNSSETNSYSGIKVSIQAEALLSQPETC